MPDISMQQRFTPLFATFPFCAAEKEHVSRWPRKNRYRARQFISSQKQEKWSEAQPGKVVGKVREEGVGRCAVGICLFAGWG